MIRAQGRVLLPGALRRAASSFPPAIVWHEEGSIQGRLWWGGKVGGGAGDAWVSEDSSFQEAKP